MQGSGKIRPIDNGRASGVKSATVLREKLVLCSALQPAIMPKLLLRIADELGVPCDVVDLRIGGEDQDIPAGGWEPDSCMRTAAGMLSLV